MPRDSEKEVIKGCIYRMNFPNGKFYIGKTINSVKYRFDQHIRESKNENSKLYNIPLYCALRKYNINLESIVVLEENIDEFYLNDREIYYISLFDAIKKGYNVAEGGNGGNLIKTFSLERKQEFCKKSIENLKKWWENASVEQRSNRTKMWISAGIEASTGRKQSKEEIEKRRLSNVKWWSDSLEEKEIRRQKFKKENPWSIVGVMQRLNCDEVEAKRLISEKNKKAWETRRSKNNINL